MEVNFHLDHGRFAKPLQFDSSPDRVDKFVGKLLARAENAGQPGHRNRLPKEEA